MAEDSTEAVEVQGEQPENEAAEESEAYWKAQARKWESVAKKARAAERELEELKGGNSELAEALERAEAAEKQLEEMRGKAELQQAAHKIATTTGVPVSMLECCADAEAMEEMAAAYKAQPKTIHAAATITGPRIIYGGEHAQTPREAFGEWAAQAFR